MAIYADHVHCSGCNDYRWLTSSTFKLEMAWKRGGRPAGARSRGPWRRFRTPWSSPTTGG
jgi:hypothetical protein